MTESRIELKPRAFPWLSVPGVRLPGASQCGTRALTRHRLGYWRTLEYLGGGGGLSRPLLSREPLFVESRARWHSKALDKTLQNHLNELKIGVTCKVKVRSKVKIRRFDVLGPGDQDYRTWSGAPPRRWKWGDRDQAAAKKGFSSEGNPYQKQKTQRIWPTIFLKMGGIIPRTLKNGGDVSPRPPCGGAPETDGSNSDTMLSKAWLRYGMSISGILRKLQGQGQVIKGHDYT